MRIACFDAGSSSSISSDSSLYSSPFFFSLSRPRSPRSGPASSARTAPSLHHLLANRLPAFSHHPNRRPNYPRIPVPRKTDALRPEPPPPSPPATERSPAGTRTHSRPAGNTATPTTPPDSRECTCLRGNPSRESTSAPYPRSPRERLPPIPRGEIEPQVPREEE